MVHDEKLQEISPVAKYKHTFKFAEQYSQKFANTICLLIEAGYLEEMFSVVEVKKDIYLVALCESVNAVNTEILNLKFYFCIEIKLNIKIIKDEK